MNKKDWLYSDSFLKRVLAVGLYNIAFQLLLFVVWATILLLAYLFGIME